VQKPKKYKHEHKVCWLRRLPDYWGQNKLNVTGTCSISAFIQRWMNCLQFLRAKAATT